MHKERHEPRVPDSTALEKISMKMCNGEFTMKDVGRNLFLFLHPAKVKVSL
jgi:hypothetical protein